MAILSISILLPIIIGIIILIISILRKHHIKPTLPAVLITIGVTAVAILIYQTVFYDDNKILTIQNTNYENFTINVRNHEESYDYNSLKFSSKLTTDEIYNEIKKQYETVFFDDTLDQIVIIDNNEIYAINNEGDSKFLWTQRHHYELSCEFIQLSNRNSDTANIPFPTKTVENGLNSSSMPTDCDFDVIKKYYQHFDAVEIGNNTITFSDDQYKYNITVKNNKVNLRFNNLNYDE